MAIASGVAARREEFARMITGEGGKSIRDARMEVDRAVLVFTLGADEARHTHGEFMPFDLVAATAGRWGITRRFPAGPVGAITPFNFPLNLGVHKIAAAFACGNPVVLKPAEKTPITSLMLAEVIENSDWPKGAFSVVAAKEPRLGEILATDPRIKVLSFTGAAGIGWKLKEMASKKRVTLELGGNAAVLVHEDADIPFAVGRCVLGAFANAGQVCISVQRIYVHRPVLEEFVERFVAGAKALRAGDPYDETTDVVPMITEAAAIKAQGYISEAISAGARPLLLGLRDGAKLAPTVLTNTKPEMFVCREEVFAPIVAIEPYDDFSEALAWANESVYGLQAGIFTKDINRLFQAFTTLEVGGVMANEVPMYRSDNMPYGGEKASGFGREGLRYAIEEMTEMRVLALNLPPMG
jgi:glyceraldehyde-3-phosphate dehydrogenase (NADP+)